MARLWLRGCAASDLGALLLLLLLRPPATPGTTCSTPTSIEHADIRVKSYSENSRERYVCNPGFKRKAGTSSLTKCLRNEEDNITQWTIPSLKCIRDPSLTHQRPPSTVAPAGVTPEPASPSPSGKGTVVLLSLTTQATSPRVLVPNPGCPRSHLETLEGNLEIGALEAPPEPAFTSISDTPVATKPATAPGSRLMPSEPPPARTSGVVRSEPSQVPSQTTAKALEHTPSTSLEKPGAHSYNSRTVAVAVSTPGAVLCGLCVIFLLVCYRRSRQTPCTPSVEVENMEASPMTGGTNGREDRENDHTA